MKFEYYTSREDILDLKDILTNSVNTWIRNDPKKFKSQINQYEKAIHFIEFKIVPFINKKVSVEQLEKASVAAKANNEIFEAKRMRLLEILNQPILKKPQGPNLELEKVTSGIAGFLNRLKSGKLRQQTVPSEEEAGCTTTFTESATSTESNEPQLVPCDTSTANMVCYHRGVAYEKQKLTSLGYRIEIIKSVSDLNGMRITLCQEDQTFIFAIDLAYIIGDYPNYNAARSSIDKLLAEIVCNNNNEVIDGLKLVPFGTKTRKFVSYDYFWLHILPHITSDFAKHLRASSVVNDLVVSSGSQRAETLLEHNRAINTQCSTSQEQLESIVDQGLQSTSLKAIAPVIQPNVPVITARGVYIAKTNLKYEGMYVAKIGRSVRVYDRSLENLKAIPGFSIYHLEESKDEFELEKRLHTTFKSNQVSIKVNNKNQTELFTYETEDDFKQFIESAKTINKNIKMLGSFELNNYLEIEKERTKQEEAKAHQEDSRVKQLELRIELAKLCISDV